MSCIKGEIGRMKESKDGRGIKTIKGFLF